MQIGSVVYHYDDRLGKQIGLGTVIETDIDEDNGETQYFVSWSKTGQLWMVYDGYLEVLCK